MHQTIRNQGRVYKMERHARTHSILPLAKLMENSLYSEGPSDEEKFTVSIVE